MRTVAAALLLSLTFGLTLGACASPDPTSRDSTSEAPVLTADDLARLGVVNGRVPFPGVVTAGQLTESQFASLAELGYDTLVNLRPAEEEGAGWEEDFAATRGIEFHRIPVAGAQDATEANARRLAALMSAADGGVVVYCSSANRAGALLALKAYLLDGESPEASLAIGKAAGLTRLEPHVRTVLGLEPLPPAPTEP